MIVVFDITVLFVLFLRTNPTGWEFFDPARTCQNLIAVKLLTSDATTDERQERIAWYYDVYDEWVASEHSNNKIKKYYNLLFLVNTKSNNNKV